MLATQTSLLHTLGGRVARGAFLNAATIHFPAVVLGAVAARTLGITQAGPGTLVYVGGQYFSVVGVLRPVPLAPEIDEAALVGFPVAGARLGLGGHATERPGAAWRWRWAWRPGSTPPCVPPVSRRPTPSGR